MKTIQAMYDEAMEAGASQEIVGVQRWVSVSDTGRWTHFGTGLPGEVVIDEVEALRLMDAHRGIAL